VDNDFAALPAIVERPAPAPTDVAPYGDGHAARHAVQALVDRPRSDVIH
jgi:UDP-N-acetylglucosamine 2-epimerase (non-hydrolysing)